MFRNDEQKIFRVEAKQREFLGLTQRAYAKTTNPAAEDLSRKEPTQVTGSQHANLLTWWYSIIYKHVRLHSQHPGMQVTHGACLFFHLFVRLFGRALDKQIVPFYKIEPGFFSVYSRFFNSGFIWGGGYEFPQNTSFPRGFPLGVQTLFFSVDQRIPGVLVGTMFFLTVSKAFDQSNLSNTCQYIYIFFNQKKNMKNLQKLMQHCHYFTIVTLKIPFICVLETLCSSVLFFVFINVASTGRLQLHSC